MMKQAIALACGAAWLASPAEAAVVYGTTYTFTERTTGLDLTDTGTVTIGDAGNDGASIGVSVIVFIADFLSQTRVKVGYDFNRPGGITAPFDFDVADLVLAPGSVLSGLSVASDPGAILAGVSVSAENAFAFTLGAPDPTVETAYAEIDLQFSTAAVPLPPALALLPVALGALAWAGRRGART